MEPASIMVLVPSAGVLALLVWFEINSRRGEARSKDEGRAVVSSLKPLPKATQNQAALETEKKKAA